MADLVFTGQNAGTAINAENIAVNKDLVIYKGDYVDFTVTLRDEAGVVLNLTGYTATATLKTDYAASTTAASFTCTIPTPTNGVIRLFMSTNVTSALSQTSYIWDFEVTNPNGDSRTYLTGDVTLYPEVTL